MMRSTETRQHVEAFHAMGCSISLVIGAPLPGNAIPAREAARRARAWIEAFDRRLSRFRPESEISRMNADPGETVDASPLLCSVVSAGVWAAQRSGGLVDPTLLDALEAAGYRESRAEMVPVPLAAALEHLPPRRAAGPAADPAWKHIHVDMEHGLIKRPRGVRFDPGGVGKGLAADAMAHMLRGYSRFAIDCAGDLRIGGELSERTPYVVNVAHPLTNENAHVLQVASGGVATSGMSARLWRAGDGTFHHHLMDPATGTPAWTGLISATALAASTLEAETLAKAALLSGPSGARQVLRAHGGVAIHDGGQVELIGPLARPRLRISAQALR